MCVKYHDTAKAVVLCCNGNLPLSFAFKMNFLKCFRYPCSQVAVLYRSRLIFLRIATSAMVILDKAIYILGIRYVGSFFGESFH